MTIPLLICDDSGMARKQIARSLPEELGVEISYATNGEEGLEVIRAGKGELVFLDLTMPKLDGYGVLEALRAENIKCMVIVISADIQPEAQERVIKGGAIAFIRKPIDVDELTSVLRQFGFI